MALHPEDRVVASKLLFTELHCAVRRRAALGPIGSQLFSSGSMWCP